MKIVAGEKIGSLTIVKELPDRSSGNKVWECECDCGTVRNIRADIIKASKDKGCRCDRLLKAIEPGDVFSRLTVIRKLDERQRQQVLWECLCNCGKLTKVTTGNLNNGHTTSCGCYNRERSSLSNTIHGLSKTRIHSIWVGILTRTSNPNSPAYNRYGGRGITVHESFRTFEGFYAVMGPSYFEGLTIERIDVNGNYEPGNVRWATYKEQANNKRNNVFVEDPNTGELLTLSLLAERYGISKGTVGSRYRRGYRGKDLISTKKLIDGREHTISTLIEEVK